jgi:hypothetical protein
VVSSEEKSKCWWKITKDFNSQNPGSVFRDAASLHRFFFKLCPTNKKTAAEEKKETHKTGGGLILSIINKKTA